mmetsp:Transcript_5945/g.19942  ORF Transcript_5945/g.19942 Transcript_5945/m.19942 type:complete len:254 (-) Transcript_5945:495-1256(-)
MLHAPFKNCSHVSNPYCNANGNMPTAEQTEYLPPTQSQNANAFFGSMPNSLTNFKLVDTATMCLLTASLPNAAMIHCRTVLAFNIVSAVVNVFETTTTNVVSGFNPFKALATSTGSTLAKNLKFLPCASAACDWFVFNAVCTNNGPKNDPPIPTHTTSVSGNPVCPTHSPFLTRSEKSLILSNTSCTSGTTFDPSTLMTFDLGALVATCKTALFSVEFIASPENMALIFSFTPLALANAYNFSIVSSVTRCLA